MKNRFFRMLAFLLTLCILLPAAAACSKNPAAPGDTTETPGTGTPGTDAPSTEEPKPEPPETYGDPVQNPEPGPEFTRGEPLTQEELALFDSVSAAFEDMLAPPVSLPFLDLLEEALSAGTVSASLELESVLPLNMRHWFRDCKLDFCLTTDENGVPVFDGSLSWGGNPSISGKAYLDEDGLLLSSPSLFDTAYFITYEELTLFLVAVLGGAYDDDTANLYEPVIYYDGETRKERVDPESVELYLSLTSNKMTIAPYSFRDLLGLGVSKMLYADLMAEADEDGYIKVTEENYTEIVYICGEYLKVFGLWIYNGDASVNETFFEEFLFYSAGPKEDGGASPLGSILSLMGGATSLGPRENVTVDYEQAILDWLRENEEAISRLAETLGEKLFDAFTSGVTVEKSKGIFRHTFGGVEVKVNSITVDVTTEAFLAVLEVLREDVAQSLEVKTLLMDLLENRGILASAIGENNTEEWLDTVMTSLDRLLVTALREIHSAGISVDAVFYLASSDDRPVALEIGLGGADGSREVLFRRYHITNVFGADVVAFEVGPYRVEFSLSGDGEFTDITLYENDRPLCLLSLLASEHSDMWSLVYAEAAGDSSWDIVWDLNGTYKKTESGLDVTFTRLKLHRENETVWLHWNISLSTESAVEPVPPYELFSGILPSERRRLVRAVEKLYAFADAVLSKGE